MRPLALIILTAGLAVAISGCIFEEEEPCPEDEYYQDRNNDESYASSPGDALVPEAPRLQEHEDDLYPDPCDH